MPRARGLSTAATFFSSLFTLFESGSLFNGNSLFRPLARASAPRWHSDLKLPRLPRNDHAIRNSTKGRAVAKGLQPRVAVRHMITAVASSMVETREPGFNMG